MTTAAEPGIFSVGSKYFVFQRDQRERWSKGSACDGGWDKCVDERNQSPHCLDDNVNKKALIIEGVKCSVQNRYEARYNKYFGIEEERIFICLYA